jgi:hypothetical protein
MDFPISFAPVTEWMTAMMEVPCAVMPSVAWGGTDQTPEFAWSRSHCVPH